MSRENRKDKEDRERESRSLKVSIEAGCKRFWARRGGDPKRETSYNYGDPKKKKFK
tara:strand:+ start:5512 stop:5679 length:168 start_codon:yes stop_codon:yes gene_type:complete